MGMAYQIATTVVQTLQTWILMVTEPWIVLIPVLRAESIRMAMVRVLRQMSAIAIPVRPLRVRAAVGWRIPRVAEDLTRTGMVPQTARMAVHPTRVKPPREFVDAELQTPTPMVMARPIVTMDVLTMQVSRVLTERVVAMVPTLPVRAAPDAGM